jgi:ferrous-iron efflux pump FieF
MHDLRTRTSGLQEFIEFHMEIDGSMTVHEAHAITENIETQLYAAFPSAEVLIHQEPFGIDDDRLDDRVS